MRNVAPMLAAFRSASDLLAAAMACGLARPLEAVLDTKAACQQQRTAPEQVMDLKLDCVALLYSLQHIFRLCWCNSRPVLPAPAQVITAQH